MSTQRDIADECGRAPEDLLVVAGQIGREPREPWRVGIRCSYGFPQVVVTHPLLEDDSPFPTLYWLTCPFLAEGIGRLESAGEIASWNERIASDPGIARRMLAADAAYRALRLQEADPAPDPCSAVGVAGQSDPLAPKCLHAHAAASLAGLDDPIGSSVLERTGRECGDARCGALTCLRGEET